MSTTKPLTSSYAAFHAPRYQFLLGVIASYLPDPDERILDIGRSYLTDLIYERYHLAVDSLGLQSDATSRTGTHYHFNLNDAQQESTWRRDIPQYRLVVMAEVIEHLYTAPSLVLRFVSELVTDDGILILQTPNAVSLAKRLKILAGKNPFDRIREDPSMPGHFREYTLDELKALAEQSGFQILAHWFRHYFDSRYSRHLLPTDRPQMAVGTVKNMIGSVLPARWRSGITIVMRKKTGIPAPVRYPPPTR